MWELLYHSGPANSPQQEGPCQVKILFSPRLPETFNVFRNTLAFVSYLLKSLYIFAVLSIYIWHTCLFIASGCTKWPWRRGIIVNFQTKANHNNRALAPTQGMKHTEVLNRKAMLCCIVIKWSFFMQFPVQGLSPSELGSEEGVRYFPTTTGYNVGVMHSHAGCELQCYPIWINLIQGIKIREWNAIMMRGMCKVKNRKKEMKHVTFFFFFQCYI